MLSSYSKLELVQQGRKYGISMGDYARASKEDLINKLLTSGVSESDIASEMSGAGLLSAVRPVSAPTASAPVRTDYSGVFVVGQKPVAEAFGLKGKAAKLFEGKTVDIWNDPGAPKIMEKFRWRTDALMSVLNSMKRGDNVWLGGPAGTGKTEFVRQVCARLGRAFIRVQFNSGVEAYDIIGGERVKAGSSYWQDGMVLQGYRRPGAVILLDEVGFARPEYTSDLHAALEPTGEISVACTGEVIKKAPGVVFLAADNSNGRGDATGTYVGIVEKNEAFLSRFAKSLNFSYMSIADETEIVMDVSGSTKPLARLVCEFISVCRNRANTGLLESPPSMREAFALAGALMDGEPARYAFETTVVNRAASDCQEILQQLWAANIDEDMISQAILGNTVKLKAEDIAPEVSAID